MLRALVGSRDQVVLSGPGHGLERGLRRAGVFGVLCVAARVHGRAARVERLGRTRAGRGGNDPGEMGIAVELSVYDNPDWYAFVDGIRENPDDDLRRLVAADWLEDHGKVDRAEKIRSQVAYPGINNNERSFLWIDLGDRLPNPEVGFVRGFIESINCGWNWWLKNGDSICRREPVRRVKLTDLPPYQAFTGVAGIPEGHFRGWFVGEGRSKKRQFTLPEPKPGERHQHQLLRARWPLIPPDGWMLPRQDPFSRLSQSLRELQAEVSEVHRLSQSIRNAGG